MLNATQIKNSTELLHERLTDSILILDGAMGTKVQALQLTEAMVRGERFRNHHKDLKNFVDILCLTHPDAIRQIHREYLAAGADIIETNSFGSSPIGMEEMELPSELIRDLN